MLEFLIKLHNHRRPIPNADHSNVISEFKNFEFASNFALLNDADSEFRIDSITAFGVGLQDELRNSCSGVFVSES